VTAPVGGTEENALKADAVPQPWKDMRPVSALPAAATPQADGLDDEAMQEEMRALKAELYQCKAEVLEAYAVAASLEAQHMDQVEVLQAEVQQNRQDAAELMKAVSPEQLNAELLHLIESGHLMPADQAFDRSSLHYRNLQVTQSRPNTPARPTSALI